MTTTPRVAANQVASWGRVQVRAPTSGLVQPGLNGGQIVVRQPRGAASAGTVGQPSEARGGEALDELAGGLLVQAEGAGRLGDRGAVGHDLHDAQPFVLPAFDRPGA